MMFLLMQLAAAEPEMSWRLVGAYDTSAVATIEQDHTVDFVWTPEEGMVTSCGPAKGPSGLGIFEAEAIGAGLTPTLALVLKADTPDSPPLGPHNVRVALTGTAGQILLQPAVSPRKLAIRLEAPPDLKRYTDLVRTQLEMELCMEHKVGRGWLGGETKRVEQAFLLRKPDVANNLDRVYFGGEADPVPALIGPPDACFLDTANVQSGAKGEGSLELVPSDIWGANLRKCQFNDDQRRLLARHEFYTESQTLPFALSKEPATKGAMLERAAPPNRAKRYESWSLLVASLHANEAGDVMLGLNYDGRSVAEEPLAPRQLDSSEALIDTLARVPYYYPVVRSPESDTRYAVLLIPNWQLVEAMRRLDSDNNPTAPAETHDAVGWVLAHPDLLSLQVIAERSTALQPAIAANTPLGVLAEAIGLSEEPGGTGTQPDLSDPMTGGLMGILDWGYTLGFAAGRNPIVLPGREEPTWNQMASAQRAQHHALFLASAAAFVLVVIAGLRRLPELWTAVPEERADYWPGSAGVDESAELAKLVKIQPENK